MVSLVNSVTPATKDSIFEAPLAIGNSETQSIQLDQQILIAGNKGDLSSAKNDLANMAHLASNNYGAHKRTLSQTTGLSAGNLFTVGYDSSDKLALSRGREDLVADLSAAYANYGINTKGYNRISAAIELVNAYSEAKNILDRAENKLSGNNGETYSDITSDVKDSRNRLENAINRMNKVF